VGGASDGGHEDFADSEKASVGKQRIIVATDCLWRFRHLDDLASLREAGEALVLGGHEMSHFLLLRSSPVCFKEPS
jgi:hypothetical protein